MTDAATYAFRAVYQMSKILDLHNPPILVVQNLADFRALCDCVDLDRPVDKPEPDRFTYHGITVLWEPKLQV